MSSCLTQTFLLAKAALFAQLLQAQQPDFPYRSNRSLTWEESLRHYTDLATNYAEASLLIAGKTDVGKPLHVFVINRDQVFEPELFDRKKVICLINNSIHPGEPDGADACTRLCTELLTPGSSMGTLLDSVILCVIPVYNVDGALRRNSTTRVNQLGPESYGFRGNARNLDLNRDFIKCDSENARSFNRLFSRIRPHVFVDTHVSNGADYPYTMTLITTQPDKLGGETGRYLRERLEPTLFKAMAEAGHPMCPYVNTMGRTPESGLVDFLETPRFSTGYAALFNTIGFVTETHMLKPFLQRVEATHAFLECLLREAYAKSSEWVALRQRADEALRRQVIFPLRFSADTSQISWFRFRGYAARRDTARVGSGHRLRYDRDSVWESPIRHFRNFVPSNEVEIPRAYLIPQAWREVVERLQCNRVLMKRLERDTTMLVEATFVESWKTADKPYEGHFVHSEVHVRREMRNVNFYRGDWLVYTDQPARRYLVETLEPQGEDSFFCWNFFDSVLQQKEWFSDYVFEDVAAGLLEQDATLKRDFEQAMKEDSELRENHWQQLYWIYKRSPHYEGTARMLPVFRLPGKLQ